MFNLIRVTFTSLIGFYMKPTVVLNSARKVVFYLAGINMFRVNSKDNKVINVSCSNSAENTPERF